MGSTGMEDLRIMASISEELNEVVVQQFDRYISRLFNNSTISSAFLLADAAIIRQWFVTEKKQTNEYTRDGTARKKHKDEGETGGEHVCQVGEEGGRTALR